MDTHRMVLMKAGKKKFRVALICEAGFNTGTYAYSVNMAEQLPKQGCDVTLITPMHLKDVKAKQLVVNRFLFKIPLIGRSLWLISLYFKLWKLDFDIVQSSWYGMMDLLPFDLYKKKLKITTLFDVAGDNKQYREGQAYLFVVVKILQPPHLRFNDFIITSSHRSKDQIMKLKHIPGQKIGVAHLGVSDEFRKVTDAKLLKDASKRLGLPERFILNVGGIKVTRNIIGLIRAFGILAKKHPSLHLVFSGKLNTSRKAPKYHKLLLDEINRIDESVRGRIRFLGNVSHDELRALYSLADAFVMPSLEEGFGFPLVEAMMSGLPCVTSSISCMPETAGDAALLCDPHNPKDIAAKAEKILSDRQFARALGMKAAKRARIFSWESTARETVRMYASEWEKKFGKN